VRTVDLAEGNEPAQTPGRRKSAGATVLAAALLGVAEVLEPRPPRDLGVEVDDAPTDQPEGELELSFGHLDPLNGASDEETRTRKPKAGCPVL
jgi:hypothetical protein